MRLGSTALGLVLACAVMMMTVATAGAEFTGGMLQHPERYSCTELSAMTKEQKNVLLGRISGYRIPGMLSRIIGPDCTIFGDIQPVAVVMDPKLIVGDEPKEVLYYLPQMEKIFLSESGTQSVAYVMTEGSGSVAADRFIARRTEAESLAAFGRRVSAALSSLAAQASSRSASMSRYLSTFTQMSALPQATALTAGSKQTSSLRAIPQSDAAVSSETQGAEASSAMQSSASVIATMTGSDLAKELMLPVIMAEDNTPVRKRSPAGWIALIALVIALIAIAWRTMRKHSENPSVMEVNEEEPDDVETPTTPAPRDA